MKQDYQNKDNIIEAINDNTTNKPDHVIKAEISIEVIGEDEPTKYDKRRERWAVVACWALLAHIVSALFFIFVDMNVYSFFALIISTAICVFAFVKASDIDPKEPTGPTPWWYGAV
ncbi:hypothetical protein [Prevotella sp. 885]|uniref:hypothetical protein n=1 Tax=Prevotella sp. 885 TaxID=2022527 RepID=UPI000BA14ED4|nr:hypothetical protein [Prevotella sp. 885]OZT04096.1 hypothetical protein CHL74_07255 [Prevotella sp. 885]